MSSAIGVSVIGLCVGLLWLMAQIRATGELSFLRIAETRARSPFLAACRRVLKLRGWKVMSWKLSLGGF